MDTIESNPTASVTRADAKRGDASGDARRASASRAMLAAVLASASLFAGCSTDVSELQAWMDETRANAPRQNGRIAEPKRFIPFRYEARADVDPFSNAKLQVALAKLADRNKGGLTPDVNRRREPLESYPLDTVRLVGHLNRASSGAVALLQVDKVIFQAKVGNYVGQNFGRIMRISETEVGVKELVQDAAGDWVERETALALQEPKK